MNEGPRRFRIDRDRLPALYPTHLHRPEFWEVLGRTVATFGFLEEVMAKAVFALTGTREIPEEELTATFEKWIPKLERALSDPLGGLIIAFEKAPKVHPEAIISNPDEHH